MADRLESVLNRLEAALAAQEAENLRLKTIERAAHAALAELNDLIGASEPGNAFVASDTPPARRAEHG